MTVIGDVIMETDQSELLRAMVDVLYQKVVLTDGDGARSTSGD